MGHRLQLIGGQLGAWSGPGSEGAQRSGHQVDPGDEGRAQPCGQIQIERASVHAPYRAVGRRQVAGGVVGDGTGARFGPGAALHRQRQLERFEAGRTAPQVDGVGRHGEAKAFAGELMIGVEPVEGLGRGRVRIGERARPPDDQAFPLPPGPVEALDHLRAGVGIGLDLFGPDPRGRHVLARFDQEAPSEDVRPGQDRHRQRGHERLDRGRHR